MMKMRKTKKANLENKRTVFLQIGFVVSLALVLLAFEWTTVRSEKIEYNLLGDAVMEDDMISVKWEKKKAELPKPEIIRPIKIVDDTEDVTDEDLFVSSEVDNETLNGDPFIPESDDEDDSGGPGFVLIPDLMPEFPGGLEVMHVFLKKNLKYLEIAKSGRIEGPVYIEFIVSCDGSIQNPRILRGIGGGCDEEALRVVKMMPKWHPGYQRTKAVNVQMVLPIIYKLN